MLCISGADIPAISISTQLAIDANRIYARLAAGLLFFTFVFAKARNELLFVFNGDTIGFNLAKYTRWAAINAYCDTTN